MTGMTGPDLALLAAAVGLIAYAGVQGIRWLIRAIRHRSAAA